MENEYWFIVFSGIMFGGIIFGGQVLVNLGMSAYEISLFPHLFSFITISLLAIATGRLQFKRNMLLFFFVFGLFNAINEISQFSALILGLPVAVVGLLLYTQPLWTILISRAFLDEVITRRKILAMVLVLLGITIIVNPLTDSGPFNLWGIIVGLISGISLSGWVVYSRKSGIKGINPVTTGVGFYAATIMFVLLMYPFLAVFTQNASIMRVSFASAAEIWAYLFIFAMLAGLVPHLLLFKGSKKVPASSTGIILLLEPVSAALLAAVFLQQPLTWGILLGGGLILFSNYLIIKTALI